MEAAAGSLPPNSQTLSCPDLLSKTQASMEGSEKPWQEVAEWKMFEGK